MSTDHVVHNVVTQCMECKHCGFQKAVKMPDTIDSILAQFDAFIEAHKGCSVPASETVISEYIEGFDDGYSYVLIAIEQWIEEHSYEPRAVWPVQQLLAKLKEGGSELPKDR